MTLTPWGPNDAHRLSPMTLLGVAGVHALLLAMLLHDMEPPNQAIRPRPIIVRLVKPKLVLPVPRSEPKQNLNSVPAPAAPAILPTSPTPPPPAAKPQSPLPLLVAESTQPATLPMIEAPRSVSGPVATADVSPVPAPARTTESSAPASLPSPPPTTSPRPADYLNNPRPPYPPLSKRLGEEGVVRLNILVNPDGSVARLEVAKSSGYPRLDEAAMKTVQSSWKFEPARQDGKPVAAWVVVPILFTLRS